MKVCLMHAAIDKDAKINQNLINKIKEHGLGFKHMELKWTSSTGITNAI